MWVLFLDAAVWSNVGFGLPGAYGVPVHAGSGPMTAPESVIFTLEADRKSVV